jgi:hypothetical protein
LKIVPGLVEEAGLEISAEKAKYTSMFSFHHQNAIKVIIRHQSHGDAVDPAAAQGFLCRGYPLAGTSIGCLSQQPWDYF